ncbi:MAG: glycosyltransferase [Patescibacteria group bacterium]
MKSIVIHLLTWNGAKYLPYLFDSLKKQTCTDWELYILDNASEDGTVAAIHALSEEYRLPVTLSVNSENVGFAKGHNQLLAMSASPFVLVLNHDVSLEPDCLEKMVVCMNEQSDIAAVSPRLMRWNFSFMQKDGERMAGDYGQIFTDVVDAAGFKVYRNRRVVEQYAGMPWGAVLDSSTSRCLPVFGIPATCALYRRSALASIAFQNGEIFDSLYHSYKEDVDLAYRLWSAGFCARVATNAIAYHDRSSGALSNASDMASAKNKRLQLEYIRYHSYKNHLMTLYKNEYWQNAILDFPWILWYEGKKFLYCLLYDRHSLAGVGEIWKNRKILWERKNDMRKKRKASWKEIRKWWTGIEKLKGN